jgi:aminomethyltransferase
MIARPPSPERGFLHIVVNAGTKHADFDMIAQTSGAAARLEIASGWSLLALQGPQAADVAAAHFPDWTRLTFMTLGVFDDPDHGALFVTRSGYTGEDGFEILVRNEHAGALAETLLADERVKPVGLGARDTLRLEAGLCLYGHDLDPAISPIEADLAWTIQKRRREAADFPGAERMLDEIRQGPARKRVGIRPRDRAPAREGVEIHKDGRKIGVVTSGGFSPTLNAPISMGYVETAFSTPGTELELIVRGQKRPAEVVHVPFVPHRYARKS